MPTDEITTLDQQLDVLEKHAAELQAQHAALLVELGAKYDTANGKLTGEVSRLSAILAAIPGQRERLRV